MAQLACPRCGEAYAAANVNVALGVASCSACGEVHDLAARPALASRTPADPAGLEVHDDHLSYRWRSGPAVLGLGVFVLLWDGALLAMLVAAAQDRPEMACAGSFHLLAGAAITYLFVCTLVNRTRIAVDAEDVEIEHGPLPWPGSRALARADVRQVYVIEDRTRKGGRSWSVHVQLANGHPVRLVAGLTAPGRARFVEQWLEEKLGLVDQPVGGEHV